MKPLPPSAREAKLVASLYYHTGSPCKYGHVSKRLTATRGCYECHLAHVKRTNRSKKMKNKKECSICDSMCDIGNITGTPCQIKT